MIKKVKCKNAGYAGLTINKVYDVVEYIPTLSDLSYDRIIIINDYEMESDYFYRAWLFLDVTSEYRNEVIDNILN